MRENPKIGHQGNRKNEISPIPKVVKITMVVKPNANVPYNRLNDCLNFVTEITGAEFAQ